MARSVVGVILGVVGTNHFIQGTVVTGIDTGEKVGMADEDEWEVIQQGPLRKPVFDSAPRHPLLTAAPKHSAKPQQSLVSTAPHSLALVVPSGTPKRLPENLDHRPGSVAKLTDATRGASSSTSLQPEPQSNGRHTCQGKTSAASRVNRAKNPVTLHGLFNSGWRSYSGLGKRHQFLWRFGISSFCSGGLRCICTLNNGEVFDLFAIILQNLRRLPYQQVLDIAQTGKRNSGASGGLILKSPKWIFKHANVSVLSIMESPLIAHWDKSKIPRDRAEALPLPFT